MQDPVYLECDANGLIAPGDWDGYAARCATGAVKRLVLFAHGWLTPKAGFLDIAGMMADGLDSRFGDDTGFAALHWPSDLDDNGGPVNLLGEFSYYAMERRALRMGGIAGARIVDAAIAAGVAEVIVTGHSFGCIVAAETLCAADVPAGLAVQLVALQGAFPNDLLESGQAFSALQRRYPRIKVTTSQLDTALRIWFPLAERAEFRHDCAALGCAGPSAGTIATYQDRLSVLDLTPVHAANPSFGPDHHSDLDHSEVFDFIANP